MSLLTCRSMMSMSVGASRLFSGHGAKKSPLFSDKCPQSPTALPLNNYIAAFQIYSRQFQQLTPHPQLILVSRVMQFANRPHNSKTANCQWSLNSVWLYRSGCGNKCLHMTAHSHPFHCRRHSRVQLFAQSTILAPQRNYPELPQSTASCNYCS